MPESAKPPAPRRTWTRPELKKLGTIADVAGPAGSLNNGMATNKS